jgi:hypothetical protein
LQDRGLVQEFVSHRPAKLYSFDLDAYNSKYEMGNFHFDL